jgi:hypothetical protein
MARSTLCAFTLFALIAQLSCSSGSASPGSTGTGSCQSVCDKAAALACPNEDLTTCAAECEADLNGSPQCSSQSSSYLGCITTLQLYCDADGEVAFDEDTLLDKCGSQAMAFAGCTACDPGSSDSACELCSKQSCCSQLKAYLSDPNILPLSKCIQSCADNSSCVQTCSSQYPTVLSNYQAVQSCESSACASACN